MLKSAPSDIFHDEYRWWNWLSYIHPLDFPVLFISVSGIPPNPLVGLSWQPSWFFSWLLPNFQVAIAPILSTFWSNNMLFLGCWKQPWHKKTLSHRPDSGLATGRTRKIASMYFLGGCEGFDTCLRMGHTPNAKEEGWWWWWWRRWQSTDKFWECDEIGAPFLRVCFFKCFFDDLCCLCLRVENRTSVLHVFIMGSGWGGVGWGGVGWVDNVHLHFVTYMMLRYCASHIWCYVTVWGGVGWGDNVQLHFLTYMMLRYCASHIWCYVTVPHTYDATLL